MFTVSIMDKSKKSVRTYEHITKITYSDLVDDVVVENADILTHQFPIDYELHLYSETGNYVISPDVIGTFEIEKES